MADELIFNKVFEIHNNPDGSDAKVDTFEFGIAEVGKTLTKSFVLKNTSKYELGGVAFTTDNQYIKVIEAPKEFKIDELGKITFVVNPPLQLRKGLRCNLNVTGKRTYLP